MTAPGAASRTRTGEAAPVRVPVGIPPSGPAYLVGVRPRVR